MTRSEPLAVDLQDLSEKQREVLDLVVDRRTNKEIASLLGISASAVEQRLQSVRRRLGVTSRADLARTYQNLLDTCQERTGEKLQVADKSLAVQSHGIAQKSEDLLAEAEREERSGGVLVGGRIAVKAPANTGQWFQGSRLLVWLDRIAGMPGRIAAITVTAASLAFLLAIITRLADVSR